MSEKTDGFTWSRKRHLAAELVAEGELTDAEIAEKVGIDPRTLYRWKAAQPFASEVEKIIEEFRKLVLRRGIAQLERRVDALDRRWRAMKQIIRERAEAPEMQDVPGGKTGLLIHRMRALGAGETLKIVVDYEVDTGLLKELRDHERQAAQELGQWAKKVEHSSGIRPPLITRVDVIRPTALPAPDAKATQGRDRLQDGAQHALDAPVVPIAARRS